MADNEFLIAEVIDNLDPDEEGKVKIKIQFKHDGLPDDALPWARQDAELTSNIPEIGELVWVKFEKPRYHKNPYYGNKVTLKEYHDHNKQIGSITSVYPDVKYIEFKNGVALAFSSNNDTPELSLKHPKAEIYIDKDGNITIKGGDNTEEYMLLGETTKEQLQKTVDALTELQSAMNSWVVVAQDGGAALKTSISSFLSLPMSDLSSILSTTIKNN